MIVNIEISSGDGVSIVYNRSFLTMHARDIELLQAVLKQEKQDGLRVKS